MDILEYVVSIKSTFHSTLPPSTAEETKNPSQLPKRQTSLSIRITVPFIPPTFTLIPRAKPLLIQSDRSLKARGHCTFNTHTHTPRLHLTTTTTTTNSSQKHNHQHPLQNQTYNIPNMYPLTRKSNSQIPIRPSAPSAPPRFILPPLLDSTFRIRTSNIAHRTFQPSTAPRFRFKQVIG